MRILKAQVTTTKDPIHIGEFHVICPDICVEDETLPVNMCSPFYTINGGGMFAMPQEGTEILIIEDEHRQYYYLSTLIKQPLEGNKADKNLNFKVIEDKHIYTPERNKPQKITYEDQNGAGLSISNDYAPGRINTKTEVKSRGNKKLLLSDSKGIDCAMIKNEHGDGIIITSKDPSPFHGKRNIEVKSHGSQYFVSFEGSQNHVVADGNELNLKNTSTGANAASGNILQAGNINLETTQRDINIDAGSQVFIITPTARIQINIDGSIDIETLAGLNIKSTGPIQMKSDISIGLEAPIITANAETMLEVFAPATTMLSTLPGTPVATQTPVQPLVITPPPRNAYGK